MSGNEKPAAPTAGITRNVDTQWLPTAYPNITQPPDIPYLPYIVERLDGIRKTNRGIVARCPAHDDRRPSLSVTSTTDRILMHCFAGCPTERIVAALGLSLSDLFYRRGTGTTVPRIHANRLPIAYPAPRCVHRRNYHETAAFEYHNEAGYVVAIKRRFDFTAIYDDGSQRAEKTFSVAPSGLALPLYRLPAILSGVRNGWPVWLTEGEAKADLLHLYAREDWGMNVVVTSYGGHWRRDMAEHLAGAVVTLIPDRDEAGRRKAERVVRDLHGVALSIMAYDLSESFTALNAEESVH